MKMIEKVAKALYNNERSKYSMMTFPEFEELFPRTKEPWVGYARAALEAMLEPTDDMMAEAESEVIELACFNEKEKSLSYKAWQAMIKSALNE